MFRFLIVEDVESTRTQLQALFQEEFPESRVDVAEHVEEALSCVAKAVKEGWAYDCVVVDFKLPSAKGKNPEVDITVFQAILKDMPTAFVMHITAFDDDPIVRKHLALAHIGLRGPHWDCVSKDASFADVLIEKVRKYLFTARVEEHMDEVFGRRGGIDPPSRRDGTGEITSSGCMTHRLAGLQREIEECWGDLDDPLKERVERLFFVREAPGGGIRVSILMNARGLGAEDRP